MPVRKDFVSRVVSFPGPSPANSYIAPTAEQFLARPYPPKEPLLQGLLHRRDLVAFGAKRRNGKTSLLTNLAVALATGAPEFLGYTIPSARRSLLLMLEDDAGEYQGFLKEFVGSRALENRIRVVTKDDLMEHDIPIDADNDEFTWFVQATAKAHGADLVVLDNLAQMIAAEYNDPKRIHRYTKFIYTLAKQSDAAVVTAIHPKKDDQMAGAVDLETRPNDFFENFMGSSHFINSTGSLWGLQRKDDYAVFVGGRQRGEGTHAVSYIWRPNRSEWFTLLPNVEKKIELITKTPKRKQAWDLLPAAPEPFTYSQGEALVRPAMSSSDSYANWIREARRIGVVVDTEEGKLVKATVGGKTASQTS
jgi:hypothetical protein